MVLLFIVLGLKSADAVATASSPRSPSVTTGSREALQATSRLVERENNVTLFERTSLSTTKITATHFWDCNGAACDSRTLQPFNIRKYAYANEYAPQDPSKLGGALYGERLWMTGAASDTLSRMLGADDGCCGQVFYKISFAFNLSYCIFNHYDTL